MKTYKTELPEITLKYKSIPGLMKSKIGSSKDCEKVLRQMYDSDTLEYSESAILILLNRANVTIGWLKLSQGGISGTVIDQRIVFAVALKAGASSIILSHNHPSGNLNPSQQDKDLTRIIHQGCKLLDLELLDHIIITNESYYSFKDEGKI